MLIKTGLLCSSTKRALLHIMKRKIFNFLFMISVFIFILPVTLFLFFSQRLSTNDLCSPQKTLGWETLCTILSSISDYFVAIELYLKSFLVVVVQNKSDEVFGRYYTAYWSHAILKTFFKMLLLTYIYWPLV